MYLFLILLILHKFLKCSVYPDKRSRCYELQLPSIPYMRRLWKQHLNSNVFIWGSGCGPCTLGHECFQNTTANILLGVDCVSLSICTFAWFVKMTWCIGSRGYHSSYLPLQLADAAIKFLPLYFLRSKALVAIAFYKYFNLHKVHRELVLPILLWWHFSTHFSIQLSMHYPSALLIHKVPFAWRSL